MTTPHALIMAAGTGGHVIPGLAVARELQSRGWTVSWLGTTAGMENRLVPPSGIELDRTDFNGLRGKGVWGTILGAARLVKAFAQCYSFMRKRRPSVVVGMGGYVCFPGGWTAAAFKTPLLLVNADAKLLLSNRALLPVASTIAFGFDGPGTQSTQRAVVTGNPVRAEIARIAPPAQRFANRSGRLNILVVGGSSGAKILNDTLPAALALMRAEDRPQVTHQTGLAHADAVRASYARHGVEAQVEPFIDDMVSALSNCDAIVCRAGAITVSELCAAGVASILVPLVISTTSHQRDNAQWMAERQAATHLPQTELSPDRLASLLGAMTRQQLLVTAERAKSLAKPQSAALVADLVVQLAQRRKPRFIQ